MDVINKSGRKTGIAFINGKGGQNKTVGSIRIMDSVPPRGRSPGYPKEYIKSENIENQMMRRKLVQF